MLNLYSREIIFVLIVFILMQIVFNGRNDYNKRMEIKSLRQEAILRGCAEIYLEDSTNPDSEVIFRWKE